MQLFLCCQSCFLASIVHFYFSSRFQFPLAFWIRFECIFLDNDKFTADERILFFLFRKFSTFLINIPFFRLFVLVSILSLWSSSSFIFKVFAGNFQAQIVSFIVAILDPIVSDFDINFDFPSLFLFAWDYSDYVTAFFGLAA